MRLPQALAAVLVVWTWGCADGPTVRLSTDPSARLQAALDRAVQHEPVGGVLLVDAPGRLHFTGASGLSDTAAGTRMQPDSYFRIASISKTLTAAVVLGLAEEGRLDLDGTLAPYFPTAFLDRLHVVNRPVLGPLASGRQITIRQLLGHTTGLADYLGDADEDRNQVSDMIEGITRDPTRHWQPMELVEYAIAHTRPHFLPGQGYYYSDTNFVLLGLVVESVTGQPLHQVYRERLFSRLNMPGAYLQAYEPPASTPPADVIFYGQTVAPWVEIPAWGSGGVVSNTEELARFVRALFEGGVLRNTATFQQMQRWSDQSDGTYGLGLMHNYFPGAGLRGHNGYWGSFMYYWPERRVVICGTLNQARSGSYDFISEVVRIVADEDLRADVASGGAR